MNILVTGSAGYFASWLVPALKNYGHTILEYDKKDGCDILNINDLKYAVRDADAVVHLAAIPHYYEDTPEREYTITNVIGTLNVLHAARWAGVDSFVHTSSGGVYGFALKEEGFIDKFPFREEDVKLTHELDKYGASKLMAEVIIRHLFSEEGMFPITVLRINMIEGHWPPKNKEKVHHGWYCTKKLAIKAYLAALDRRNPRCSVVNVGVPNPKMDLSKLNALLKGIL